MLSPTLVDCRTVEIDGGTVRVGKLRADGEMGDVYFETLQCSIEERKRCISTELAKHAPREWLVYPLGRVAAV